MHRWHPREVAETIDIALEYPPGSLQRREASEDLAYRITNATPENPLAPSAASAAIEAACRAIEGDYSMAAGELMHQIRQRRQSGRLQRKYRRPSRSPVDAHHPVAKKPVQTSEKNGRVPRITRPVQATEVPNREEIWEQEVDLTVTAIENLEERRRKDSVVREIAKLQRNHGVRRFDAKAKYELRQLVEHPTFKTGFVVKVADNLIEVEFPDGRKKLKLVSR